MQKTMAKRMLAFLVGSCLAFAGCERAGDDGQGTESPVGTWERDLAGRTATLVLNADGTFSVEFAGDPAPDVKGRYTLADSQVSITDEGGPYAVPKDGGPGVYNCSVNGSQLTLVLVSDSSAGRKRVLIGTWTEP